MLMIRSAFSISAVAALLGRKQGAARCSGCVVGKDAPSLLLVMTAAPITSAKRTRRSQSARLRETRPMRINGNFALSIAFKALRTLGCGTAGEGAGAKRAGIGTESFSFSGDSLHP